MTLNNQNQHIENNTKKTHRLLRPYNLQGSINAQIRFHLSVGHVTTRGENLTLHRVVLRGLDPKFGLDAILDWSHGGNLEMEPKGHHLEKGPK